MGLGSSMAGGNPQLERHENDFYATPPLVTKALLDAHKFDGAIHECACGNGAMSMVLQIAGYDVISTDIRPLGIGTRKDFLELDTQLAPNVVTNPPFKLAATFIEHAVGTLKSEKVALMLKSTFWHAAKRWSLWNKFRPSHVHPLLWRPDFLSLGAPTMEAMWCVWDRSHTGPTVYQPLAKPA